MLIIIEGLDGAGTTTQAERLVQRLQSINYPAILTCEPSTGPIGTFLRQVLRQKTQLTAQTLSLLFSADRADHLARDILPHLDSGKLVVCDRYYHSTLAYQGLDVSYDWILQLGSCFRRPDLTIFLDTDPETAFARRKKAGRSDELFDALHLQKRIHASYHQVLKLLSPREVIRIVDGNLPPDQVANAVWHAVQEVRAR